MRRVAIVASASGNGKTTLGRELAQRLDVPFVELDALVHGPNWVQTPNDELRRLMEPVLAGDGWVVDGTYRSKLGDLVLRSADVVVWLDQPIAVWLPRLVRRTWRRIRGHEPSGTTTVRRCAAPSSVASRSSCGRFASTSGDAGTIQQSSRRTRSCASARHARSRTGYEESTDVRRRRERHSAAQAKPRRPSQIGVSST